MILAVVLATILFKGDDFTVALPVGSTVTRTNINFETYGYTVRDRHNVKIAFIDDGGGYMPIKGFRPLCLHGHRAWFMRTRSFEYMLSGNNAVDSVGVAYRGTNKALREQAYTIMMSLRVDDGVRC